MALLTCSNCGHRASSDYVAMADECPSCKTSPFPIAEEAASETPSFYATSFPLAAAEDAHWTERVVTEGHANYCREHGHATRTVNGVVSPNCPRCGDPLDAIRVVDEDADEARREDAAERAAAERERDVDTTSIIVRNEWLYSTGHDADGCICCVGPHVFGHNRIVTRSDWSVSSVHLNDLRDHLDRALTSFGDGSTVEIRITRLTSPDANGGAAERAEIMRARRAAAESIAERVLTNGVPRGRAEIRETLIDAATRGLRSELVLKTTEGVAYPARTPEGDAIIEAWEREIAPDPVGTLYLAPNGDAYRLRDYSVNWRAEPFTGKNEVPRYSVHKVDSMNSSADTLPEGVRVVWRPAPEGFVDPLGRMPGDVLILAASPFENTETGIGYEPGTEFLVREVREGGSDGQAMYLVVAVHAPDAGEYLLHAERFERN